MEEKNKNKKLASGSKKKTTNKINSKQTTEKKLVVQDEKQKKEKNTVLNSKSNFPTKKGEPVLKTNDEMLNLIKIILAIVAISLIFYGITTIVTKNNKKDNGLTEEVNIQYDEILVGTLFEQPNSEYYVLVVKDDDYYYSAYTSLLSVYTTKEKSIRVYTADLTNAFNKTYQAEESNIKTTDLQQLKFSDSTLIKIKDKKIVAGYEGSTDIITHLNSLLK